MHVEAIENVVTIVVESEGETEQVGRALADLVTPGVVIGLIGPLGAGKTRLTRALAEALGVDPGAIASPTFVLIHEYDGRLPVYHFDTYRLADEDAFDALGVADYWDAGGVCLVEWADRVAGLLPPSRWSVAIEPTGPSRRRLHVEFPAGSGLASRLATSLNAGQSFIRPAPRGQPTPGVEES